MRFSAFVPQADISRALTTLTTSEEAVSLLAVPANLCLEPAVPVPYRDEAEFPDGMPAAAFGIHANKFGARVGGKKLAKSANSWLLAPKARHIRL